MTEQMRLARERALALVGNGYIYGAKGQTCSPAFRQQQAAQYPQQAANILGTGAKWDGKPVWDCAQLTRTVAAAAGVTLVSGATSQWNTTPWARSGELATVPENELVFVYRKEAGSKSTMAHTGVALGDGTCVHARGTAYGVVRQTMAEYAWTHWASPWPGADAEARAGDSAEASASDSGAQAGEPPAQSTATNTPIKDTPAPATVSASDSGAQAGEPPAQSTATNTPIKDTPAPATTSASDSGAQAGKGPCQSAAADPSLTGEAQPAEGGMCDAPQGGMCAATVTAQSGSTVNLRSAPEGRVLKRVPIGTTVTVYEESGGWSRICADGLEGWMQSAFLWREAWTIEALGSAVEDIRARLNRAGL